MDTRNDETERLEEPQEGTPYQYRECEEEGEIDVVLHRERLDPLATRQADRFLRWVAAELTQFRYVIGAYLGGVDRVLFAKRGSEARGNAHLAAGVHHARAT